MVWGQREKLPSIIAVLKLGLASEDSKIKYWLERGSPFSSFI